jgi:CHASE2 domain-containing sensor protein
VLSNNVPAGFLNKEIVFVGQDFLGKSAGDGTTEDDQFKTPYSDFNSTTVAGVRIHETALLNLIRGEWLTRIPLPWQWLGAVSWAVLVTSLLYSLSRGSKIVLYFTAFAVAMVLCAISLHLQWHAHCFWGWMGPALGQTPLALALVMRSPRSDPYLAFISYRTEEDGSTALLIRRALAERGLKAFIDNSSLEAGKFNEQLLREIESSTFFILLLSANSLTRCANEGDWVLRELTHALERRKKIIPVMKSGFSFDAPSVPKLPQIAELKNFHGLMYSNSDFDGFMEKLRTLLKVS